MHKYERAVGMHYFLKDLTTVCLSNRIDRVTMRTSYDELWQTRAESKKIKVIFSLRLLCTFYV